MAITTTSDLNSLFNNLYEASWHVQRDWKMMPALMTQKDGLGMAPRILSGYTQHSASIIAEGGTPTATALAKTPHGTVTPFIGIHYGILTDEDIATDPDDAIDALAMEAGMSLGVQVDGTAIARFSGFTHSVGAGSSILSLAEIQTAMAHLSQSNAVGPRYGVIGVGQWLSLSTALTQTGGTFQGMYGNVGEEALRQNWAGQFLGASWFQNTNIGTTLSSGTATGGVFTRRALVYDERSVGGPSFNMEVNRPRHGGRYDITTRLRHNSAVDHAAEGCQLISSNAIS